MKTQQMNSRATNFLMRLAAISKSIAIGFLVSTIGIAIWSADIHVFGLSPVPMISMLVPLWLYWKFFSGQRWLKNRWASRSASFRNVKLSSTIWKWGFLASLLFVVVIQSAFVITFRLTPLPDSFSSQYKVIETLSMPAALLAIFISSLVAGVCEEVGFRGYMQVPLEKRFSPAFAIVVVSIIFSLIHLDRSWAVSILPIIFFASVLLGVLAYQSQSLLPGILGHTLLDIFDYSFWWTKVFGKFDWKTVFVTGIDAHFMIWVFIFAASTLAFILSIKKLRRNRPAA
jgi:membrane protease YdiL (CAAX protease family)